MSKEGSLTHLLAHTNRLPLALPNGRNPRSMQACCYCREMETGIKILRTLESSAL